MQASSNPVAAERLMLGADTAADLMSTDPLSISQNATITEAAAFLVEKEISAAPVIDDAGRAVGVLSHTDIVRYQGRPDESLIHGPEFYHVADLFWPPAVRKVLHLKTGKHTHVKEIMTPTVHSILPQDSALAVVAHLLAIKVHRLFVIDETGVLVGVISTFDVLRKLHK